MSAARDTDQLLEALRANVPGCARAQAVTPLSTGHSNETYLLEGASAILRLPPNAEPLVSSAHDVLTQSAILRAVGGIPGAPPVPEVLHVERTPELLGAPFFLMSLVEGETFSEYEAPAWLTEPDDEFRETAVNGYVDAIADVHRLGPLPLLGKASTVTHELQRWRAAADEARAHELVGLFDELARTAPSDGEPTLVHGDPKPVNVLFQSSRVAALLDWEMSFNGDPRWDLGYMLVFFPGELHPGFTSCDLPGMPDGAAMVKRWEARTGRRATQVGWFEAASQAKITAILAFGHHLAETGRSDDERMRAWGPYVQHFLAQTRNTVSAAVSAVG